MNTNDNISCKDRCCYMLGQMWCAFEILWCNWLCCRTVKKACCCEYCKSETQADVE